MGTPSTNSMIIRSRRRLTGDFFRFTKSIKNFDE